MVKHSNILRSKDYVCLFGNLDKGWEFKGNNLSLQQWGKKACYLSSHKSIGDVTLFKDGRLIRSCHNFQNRILNKKVKYKIKYTKYCE